MRRLKFASIHLFISALVGAGVLSFLFLVWYPSPIGQIQGAGLLALLIIGIDVILGPLLTAVVAKAGKSRRELTVDLSIIGTLQLAALIYGLSIAAQSRPAYLVGTPQRFTVVSANDLHYDPPAAEAYQSPSWFGAQLVGAKLPDDPKIKQAMIDAVIDGKPDMELRPGYYLPYSDIAADVYAKALPVEQLLQRHPSKRDAITGWLRDKGIDSVEAVRYQPLFGREGIICMLLGSDGTLIGAYPISPD